MVRSGGWGREHRGGGCNYFLGWGAVCFCCNCNCDESYDCDDDYILAVAQGLYAANRFIAAGLMTMSLFRPRFMLAFYLGMCAVFAIAAMNTQGTAGIALFIMIFVFESCCFATIFSLALKGIGRHTKRGGSFLVSAISGGGESCPTFHIFPHSTLFVPNRKSEH